MNAASLVALCRPLPPIPVCTNNSNGHVQWYSLFLVTGQLSLLLWLQNLYQEPMDGEIIAAYPPEEHVHCPVSEHDWLERCAQWQTWTWPASSVPYWSCCTLPNNWKWSEGSEDLEWVVVDSVRLFLLHFFHNCITQVISNEFLILDVYCL